MYRAPAKAALAALITALMSAPAARAQPGSALSLLRQIEEARTTAASAPLRLEDPPGVHNLWRFGAGVYSGSMPEGRAGFESLAELGVKTIVSVDGARPDLENAGAHAIRYVHVPVRYSTIELEEQLALARALRDMPRPIYVHCHHGRHRGPAAAALALVALGEIDPESGVELLRRAGTSPDYPGLYACVREGIPFDDALIDRFAPELTEHARVTGFVAAMASIDRTWDNLKLLRDNDWSPPPDHPDLFAPAEAAMLHDSLGAAMEDPETPLRPQDFLTWLDASLTDAKALEDALVGRDHAGARRAMARVAESCSACHDAYRNE